MNDATVDRPDGVCVAQTPANMTTDDPLPAPAERTLGARPLPAVLAAVALAACGDGTEPEAGTEADADLQAIRRRVRSGYPAPRSDAEAARFLGLSDRTMEKHRCYGTGPVYRKIGGRVVYRLEDVLAYEQARQRRSTADRGAA